jgi:quinol monooxygenase YgiN
MPHPWLIFRFLSASVLIEFEKKWSKTLDDKQVVLKGVLIAGADDHAIINAHLEAHIHLSRAESGCLAFDVVQDMKDQTRYRVSETFANRAAFESHQRRVKTSTWGRATAHMRREYQITEKQGVET